MFWSGRGARLVPNRRVSRSSTIRAPGASCPERISARSRLTVSSTRLVASKASGRTAVTPTQWQTGPPAGTNWSRFGLGSGQRALLAGDGVGKQAVCAQFGALADPYADVFLA